jgi:hypothetical protein
LLDYAPTPEPPSVFVDPRLPNIDPWVRPVEETYTRPSVRDSGTLRPAAEWYPAWMQYRQREDNYVFWQDKFTRCSLDIPGAGLWSQCMAHKLLGWCAERLALLWYRKHWSFLEPKACRNSLTIAAT